MPPKSRPASPKAETTTVDVDTGGWSRDHAMAVVTKDSLNLAMLPMLYKNDPDICRVAVRKFGYALKHASPGMQSDKEVVALACRNWARAIQFASDALKDDRIFIINIVKQNPPSSADALQYASDNVKNDKAAVIAAVEAHGRAMK